MAKVRRGRALNWIISALDVGLALLFLAVCLRIYGGPFRVPLPGGSVRDVSRPFSYLLVALVARGVLATVRAGRLRRQAPKWVLAGLSLLLTAGLLELALRVAIALDRDSIYQLGDLAQRREPGDEKLPWRDVGLVSGGGMIQLHPNDRIVFDLKPHLRGVFMGVPFATNAWGMNDREYPLARSPGVVRIAVLGDSFAFGFGIPDSMAICRRLEQVLTERGDGCAYEAMNFGVPAYNTVQSVELFKDRALQFSPDIAICYYVQNDRALPSYLKASEEAWTLERWFLGRWLRNQLTEAFHVQWRDLQEQEDEAHRRNEGPLIRWQDLREEDAAGPNSPRLRRLAFYERELAGWEPFERALREMGQICQERGIHALFLCYNDSILDNDEPWVREENERSKGIAAAAGFRVVDTEEMFRGWMAEHPDKKVREVIWLNHGDRHPGISATRRVAGLVASAMTDWLDRLAAGCAAGGSAAPDAAAP